MDTDNQDNDESNDAKTIYIEEVPGLSTSILQESIMIDNKKMICPIFATIIICIILAFVYFVFYLKLPVEANSSPSNPRWYQYHPPTTTTTTTEDPMKNNFTRLAAEKRKERENIKYPGRAIWKIWRPTTPSTTTTTFRNNNAYWATKTYDWVKDCKHIPSCAFPTGIRPRSEWIDWTPG